MIEILIIVCVVLLIWKWSSSKSKVSPTTLGVASQNSKVAYDNAAQNIQVLHSKQASVNQQLQSTLNSIEKTANSQLATVQVTQDATQIARKTSTALNDPNLSSGTLPQIQNALNIIEAVKQEMTQSSAIAEQNQKTMNSQVELAQALITSTTGSYDTTKAVVDDLSNQAIILSQSITTSVDNDTMKANEILVKGESLQKKLNSLEQALSSVYSHGKLLIPQFLSSMQTLIQIYKNVSIMALQYHVLEDLTFRKSIISNSEEPLFPENIKSELIKMIGLLKQNGNGANALIKDVPEVLERRINPNSINEFYYVMAMLTKNDFEDTSKNDPYKKGHFYNMVLAFINKISGFVNPIQQAILTANSLQSNAMSSIKQIKAVADKLITVVNTQNIEAKNLVKNIPNLQSFVNIAVQAQKNVETISSYIPPLHQELSNAIHSEKNAQNINSQNTARLLIQDTIKKIQPVLQNYTLALQDAKEKQVNSTLNLKTFSDAVNNVKALSVISSNTLVELNHAIAKSKIDTQSAINQAKAVQEFITSFTSYLDSERMLEEDEIDDVISDTHKYNKYFEPLDIKTITDEILINSQQLIKSTSEVFDRFFVIFGTVMPSILGRRVLFTYDDASKKGRVTILNVDKTTNVETSVLDNREYPLVDVTPSFIKSFSQESFLGLFTSTYDIIQNKSYTARQPDVVYDEVMQPAQLHSNVTNVQPAQLHSNVTNVQNAQPSFEYKNFPGQYWDGAKSGEYKCPNAKGVDLKGDGGNFANYCIFTGDDGEKYAQEYCNTDEYCVGYVMDVGKIQLIDRRIGVVENSSKPYNNFNVKQKVQNAQLHHSVPNNVQSTSTATQAGLNNNGSVSVSSDCDVNGRCVSTICQNGACREEISYASSTGRQCINGICSTTKCANGVCTTTTDPALQASFTNRRRMVFDAVKKDNYYDYNIPLHSSMNYY